MWDQPGLVAHEVPCLAEGRIGTKPAWAEEPPTFHFASLLLKFGGFSDLYVKILPLLCLSFLLFGCLRLLELLDPKTAQNRALMSAFLLLTPFIYVHAARFVPDMLMLASLPWFLYYYIAGRHRLAILVAVLAVTTKATAYFLVAALMAAHFAYGNETPEKKLVLALGYTSSVLPMLLWLAWLRWNGIDNPFFGAAVDFSRHTGGSDFSLLASPGYWGRFFTWVIGKGISIPSVLLLLWGLRGWKEKPGWEKALYLTSAAIVPYWIVVRGPQYSAPWYSFPFLLPLMILAALSFRRLERRWLQLCALALLAASSITKLSFSSDVGSNVGFRVADRPVQISCRPQNL